MTLTAENTQTQNNYATDVNVRPRRTLRFEVDVDNPDRAPALDAHLYFKKKRRWKPTMTKAAIIAHELDQGITDTLFEEYPWLVNHLPANVIPISEYKNAPENSRGVQLRPRKEGVNLADLESTFEVKTATNTEDNKSNWNFAISSALAVFGNANSLPDEVIQYGLRTKRLQPSHVSDQRMKKIKAASDSPPLQHGEGDLGGEVNTGNAKPMAGANIQFDAPADDDFDDITW